MKGTDGAFPYRFVCYKMPCFLELMEHSEQKLKLKVSVIMLGLFRASKLKLP